MDPIVCPSFTAFNCYLPTECTTSWGFFKSNVKNKHEEKTCSHHNKYNILKEENKKIQLWVKMEFRMCFCLVFYYCLLVCLFFQCTCTSLMIKSFYVHVPPMKQTDLSGRQSRQVQQNFVVTVFSFIFIGIKQMGESRPWLKQSNTCFCETK